MTGKPPADFDFEDLEPEGRGYEPAPSESASSSKKNGSDVRANEEPARSKQSGRNRAPQAENLPEQPEMDEFGELEQDGSPGEFEDLDELDDLGAQNFFEPDASLSSPQAPRSPNPEKPFAQPAASQAARFILARSRQASTSRVLMHYADRHMRGFAGAGYDSPSPALNTGAKGLLPAGLENWIDPESCSTAILEDFILLQALSTAASLAKDPEEAASLVTAMVPVTIRLYPGSYRALWPTLPALLLGASSLARLFHRTAPPRVRLIPAILLRAVAHLAGYASRGRPLDGPLTAAVLARQVAQALTEPLARRRPGSESRHGAAMGLDGWE